jgi:class 3 adenylate cyclase
LATGRVERRLAAILAADVAGYSRLIEADEEGPHEWLETIVSQLGDPKLAAHKGRIAKSSADGIKFPRAIVSLSVDGLWCHDLQHATEIGGRYGEAWWSGVADLH